MKKEIKHINLKEIKNPEFLSSLTYSELDLLSTDIGKYIVEVTSTNGGHLSSNLGVVDATIALCRSFDFKKDKIIFDVGHQCYTYKILTGRDFSSLRKTDGISGFQKMSESPYDHYECGHSSTSISAANGFAIARDLNKENYNIVAFIGDSSIVNGLAMEGLNNAGFIDHKIIVVLNDNGMSISKPKGSLSKFFRSCTTTSFYIKSKHRISKILEKTKFGRLILKGLSKTKNFIKNLLVTNNMFDIFGYKYIGPIDGHNIKQMEKAFAKAKQIRKSVIVHIKTKKGKGYGPAENDKQGIWHGVGQFDVLSGKQIVNPNLISWSDTFGEILYQNMKENPRLFTIVPATSIGSSLEQISSDFKDRYIDVGIAEEHAVTLASGIALNGYHPIISMYSTFLQRAYDQINHDLARQNCNATILIDRSGLVGFDGDTHQGVFDEQILLGVPNLCMAMPSSISEAKMLFKESLNNHGVFAIRYPREALPKEHEEDERVVPFGKWKEELKGKKTAIVSVGPITLELKKALITQKKNVTLINAIYQKPMDDEKIDELLSYDKIIIYDAYSIKNGFANLLAAKLMSLSYQGKVIVKAIDDQYIKQDSIAGQRAYFKINVEDIIKEI